MSPHVYWHDEWFLYKISKIQWQILMTEGLDAKLLFHTFPLKVFILGKISIAIQCNGWWGQCILSIFSRRRRGESLDWV